MTRTVIRTRTQQGRDTVRNIHGCRHLSVLVHQRSLRRRLRQCQLQPPHSGPSRSSPALVVAVRTWHCHHVRRCQRRRRRVLGVPRVARRLCCVQRRPRGVRKTRQREREGGQTTGGSLWVNDCQPLHTGSSVVGIVSPCGTAGAAVDEKHPPLQVASDVHCGSRGWVAGANSRCREQVLRAGVTSKGFGAPWRARRAARRPSSQAFRFRPPDSP